MKIKIINKMISSKKGSMTIFVALAMTAVIGVSGLFINDLMKKKMTNNIIRSEDLISESLLNTYDKKLYEGFMLLGYDHKSPAIDEVIAFYESKHQVEVNYMPVNMLDDKEIIRQSKLIVNSTVGLSAVDEIIIKVGLKDDIISVVRNSRNIMEKSERALKVWDEASKKFSDILDILIDIKNLYAINEMEDLQLLKIERTINKAVEILKDLKGTVKDVDDLKIGTEKLDTNSSFDLSSIDIEDEKMSIYTQDGKALDLELQSLNNSIKKYRVIKRSGKDTSSIEESIISIIDNIEFKSITNDNNSKPDGQRMLKKLKDAFNNDISVFKTIENDTDLILNGSKEKSKIQLSLTDKAYMIEYFTIVCSDDVKSELRDNHKLNREYTDKFGQYELEYLITGKIGNDATSSVKNRIRALRFALNILHLTVDNEKSTTIDALSTAIFASSSIPPQIIKGIITVVWSGFETEADLRVIYSGKGVPLLKANSDSWITDFDLDGIKDKERNETSNNELLGKSEFYYLYYNDYLRMIGMSTEYDEIISRFKVLVSEYIGVDDFDIENLAVSHEIFILEKGIIKDKKKQVIKDGY